MAFGYLSDVTELKRGGQTAGRLLGEESSNLYLHHSHTENESCDVAASASHHTMCDQCVTMVWSYVV